MVIVELLEKATRRQKAAGWRPPLLVARQARGDAPAGAACAGGRSDRAGWRGLFLRQVGNCDFHRAIDRDSGNAFVLIDPCVQS